MHTRPGTKYRSNFHCEQCHAPMHSINKNLVYFKCDKLCHTRSTHDSLSMTRLTMAADDWNRSAWCGVAVVSIWNYSRFGTPVQLSNLKYQRMNGARYSEVRIQFNYFRGFNCCWFNNISDTVSSSHASLSCQFVLRFCFHFSKFADTFGQLNTSLDHRIYLLLILIKR